MTTTSSFSGPCSNWILLSPDGDKNAWCVYMHASVCYTDFSKATTVTDFCQLIVLMNFYALEDCFGFMDLGLKISE